MDITVTNGSEYNEAVEVWRPVVGYEGRYDVSNYGRVRSIGRYDNIGHYRPDRILRAPKTPAGYPHVHLSKNGVARWYLVHRLVTEAFLEKVEGCNIVNHLDNNPANNHVDNLEWTTYTGNMQWAAKQGRMHGCPQNLDKSHLARRKPVIATKDGVDYEFDSQTEAAECLNLYNGAKGHIAAACRRDRGYKTVGGYEWRYKYV